MIEIEHLSKRYGATTALDDVCVNVLPGRVTGLLGPNGAGKSTLLRVIVGLDHPTSGRALIGGRLFARTERPLRTVGAHLGGRPWHPRRSARSHLLALARTNRLPHARVGEVLEIAGLAGVGRRPAGGFSLGMAQRLGLASALLGDPGVLLLDEPVNGLDTDGVRWIRQLMRELADEGRTVLVSSHLMSEMQSVADRVVVLGRGQLLADVPTAELSRRASNETVLVTSLADAADRLRQQLPGVGLAVEHVGADTVVRATDLEPRVLGQAAHAAGVPVLHLAREDADLEAGYLDLVAGHGDFVAEKEANGVG